MHLNLHQARWIMFNPWLDFILFYWPGTKNIKPDALSRQWDPDMLEPTSQPVILHSQVVALL